MQLNYWLYFKVFAILLPKDIDNVQTVIKKQDISV